MVDLSCNKDLWTGGEIVRVSDSIKKIRVRRVVVGELIKLGGPENLLAGHTLGHRFFEEGLRRVQIRSQLH